MIRNGYRHKRVIRGETAIKIGEDFVCPCCLRIVNKKNVSRHHVMPYMDGGHGYRDNILVICNTCHSKETFGSEESAWAVGHACRYFMLSNYGLMHAAQYKGEHKKWLAIMRWYFENEDIGPVTFFRMASDAIKESARGKYETFQGLCVRADEDEIHAHMESVGYDFG